MKKKNKKVLKTRKSKQGRKGLTEADIKKIKAGLKKGLTQQFIAEKMGLSQSFISQVKTGRAWVTA